MQYFICGKEGQFGDNYLYLVGDVRIEVGKGRPFLAKTDIISDADTDSPVYPIRGSWTEYQVRRISASGETRGKNCNVYLNRPASGLCYRTTFGDWSCKMVSEDYRHPDLNDVVPPQ